MMHDKARGNPIDTELLLGVMSCAITVSVHCSLAATAYNSLAAILEEQGFHCCVAPCVAWVRRPSGVCFAWFPASVSCARPGLVAELHKRFLGRLGLLGHD
eukprot:3809515-Pleurochrysis_carterae.AAC.2